MVRIFCVPNIFVNSSNIADRIYGSLSMVMSEVQGTLELQCFNMTLKTALNSVTGMGITSGHLLNQSMIVKR